MEQSTLILDQLEEYEFHLRMEEKSKVTIEKYMRDICAFYRFLSDDKLVTKESVIEYKNSLSGKYEPVSINSMLAAINGFLHFLELDHCKVKKLKVQRQMYCEESKELTKKEYLKLLAASEAKGSMRIHLIIQTICGTGIRISELEYFTVAAVKSGQVKVNCKGKTRTVFIPATLRKKLLIYMNKQRIKSGCIFITKSGKSVDRSNIWTEMQRIGRAAGVEATKVFPHNLRHLFARTYYKMKKDLGKLADILGHSSIETTRIYTISTGKEHERQIECLGLVI